MSEEHWRIIENPDDGTSQWDARVVYGEGVATVVRAMFVDLEAAREYVAWLNSDSYDTHAQLAEALSQRQAAVEEAERLARLVAEWADEANRLGALMTSARHQRDTAKRELAAANQDAEALAKGIVQECEHCILDRPFEDGSERDFDPEYPRHYFEIEMNGPMMIWRECTSSAQTTRRLALDALAAHRARLASQPPAEAEGA